MVSFELSTIFLFNFHVSEWGWDPTSSAILDGRNFVGGPNKGKGGGRVELLLKLQIPSDF